MTRVPLFVLLLAMTTLAACRRESPTPASSAPSGAATRAAPASAPPRSCRSRTWWKPRRSTSSASPIRRKPRRTRAWCRALMAYAGDRAQGLIGAVEALGNDTPTAPYELSLSYTTLVDSPTLVAIAADGSRYTGGAHGSPLIARFVWLPKQGAMLTSDKLVPDAKGWQAISDFVREQLHTALSQRIDADDVPAEERADMLKNAGEMIDDGTEPEGGVVLRVRAARRRRRQDRARCASSSRPTRWGRTPTARRPSTCPPKCCCRTWRPRTGPCSAAAEPTRIAARTPCRRIRSASASKVCSKTRACVSTTPAPVAPRPGIRACTTRASSAAFSRRVRSGSASRTWTAGGTSTTSTACCSACCRTTSTSACAASARSGMHCAHA